MSTETSDTEQNILPYAVLTYQNVSSIGSKPFPDWSKEIQSNSDRLGQNDRKHFQI